MFKRMSSGRWALRNLLTASKPIAQLAIYKVVKLFRSILEIVYIPLTPSLLSDSVSCFSWFHFENLK